MGDIWNTYLTITTLRKKITSPSLLIIVSKLRKNRRIRFRDLYIISVNISYKLPKEELLLALKTINLNTAKFLTNSLRKIRFN